MKNKDRFEKEQWWLPDEQLREILVLEEKVDFLENNILFLINLISDLISYYKDDKVQVGDIVNKQNIPVETEKTCPSCGSKMRRRTGKYGDFWGCTKYPNCKMTIRIDKTNKNFTNAKDVIYKIKNNIKNASAIPNSNVVLPWEIQVDPKDEEDD